MEGGPLNSSLGGFHSASRIPTGRGLAQSGFVENGWESLQEEVSILQLFPSYITFYSSG
jgi:hypothetical protein